MIWVPAEMIKEDEMWSAFHCENEYGLVSNRYLRYLIFGETRRWKVLSCILQGSINYFMLAGWYIDTNERETEPQ